MSRRKLVPVQFVAPDGDRPEGERALAQPGDHRLAAGFDAFGDRDLALAGEKLETISRRYIRTGSSVRSAGFFASDFAGVFGVASTSSPASVSSSSGSSRASSSASTRVWSHSTKPQPY